MLMNNKCFIVWLCVICWVAESKAQEASKLMRLSAATAQVAEDFYQVNTPIFFKYYGVSSLIMGDTPKKTQPLPIENKLILEKLLKSLSNQNSVLNVSDEISNITFKTEVGCPPKNYRKRKFPCTLHDQLSGHMDSIMVAVNDLFLIPVFYVRNTTYDAPASGGAIFTMADSGYDWNYTWYTLS